MERSHAGGGRELVFDGDGVGVVGFVDPDGEGDGEDVGGVGGSGGAPAEDIDVVVGWEAFAGVFELDGFLGVEEWFVHVGVGFELRF